MGIMQESELNVALEAQKEREVSFAKILILENLLSPEVVKQEEKFCLKNFGFPCFFLDWAEKIFFHWGQFKIFFHWGSLKFFFYAKE
jgi:hypothetical protein